jgi:hypothetical protein
VEAIEARASACTWARFAVPTTWFHQRIWDLGVAALDPSGRVVRVLAATDLD